MLPFESPLGSLDPANEDYAAKFVNACLDLATAARASDLHLQPTEKALLVKLRIDGVLHTIIEASRGTKTDVVTRLKVVAQLLTYRTDIPQEGRITAYNSSGDLRVCTFPTIFGERAVVRFFAQKNEYLFPEHLGLPHNIAERFQSWLDEPTGLIIVSGPAGSGKSTTTYAGMRHIARTTADSRSLVSLEDPVEVVVPQVAQAQVNPAAGFSLAKGLVSVLRQDPEVILIGEIRDPTTCEIAFQAALTGHLILTTFHAGGTAEAISRLLDMGLEPYALRSGLKGLISQRLLRQLCDCSRLANNEDERCGLELESARVAVGCGACHQTGYSGRVLVAECLPPLRGELRQAILAKRDAQAIEELAISAGMVPLHEMAANHVLEGKISAWEYRRVFGDRK